jgi:hypothetical protein
MIRNLVIFVQDGLRLEQDKSLESRIQRIFSDIRKQLAGEAFAFIDVGDLNEPEIIEPILRLPLKFHEPRRIAVRDIIAIPTHPATPHGR